MLLESASRLLSIEGGLGALVQSKLHAYVITERFDGSQQARLFDIIFCVGLQVIHLKEVADLSMGGVVPMATLVQEGA